MVLIFWRIVLLVMNAVCIGILFNRYRLHHKEWNPTTRDYWWTLLLWSAAAVVTAMQGILEHRRLTAGLVFITIASLATPIGLYRKSAERRRDQNL